MAVGMAARIAYASFAALSILEPLIFVAAFLVVVALVILAQAPDGAAPAAKAPTGPDAVAANIVNTVCASCILMGYILVVVCV